MSVLSFTTTAPGASADYVKYLYDQPLLTDRLGDPNFLDFQLAPVDNAFVKLTRGNYITLTTVSQGIWFTGYIQNDPELEKLGTQIVAGVPTEVFGFKYEVSSDEYVLNLKPIGVLPAFLNKTQGYILKKLAAIMAPTVTFDVSGIADGLSIARYIPDQTARFSDIVKEFCDSGNMRFAAKNHILTFVQQDTTPATITIDGNDPHFTSANLTIKRTNEAIVNDAIVLGDVEPNNYMTEYFVGDGITAHFPLVSSVFGVDSTLLLDDDFSSTTFDETKWAVFDEPANFLQLFNGYVNVLGGAGDNSYDVHLDSQNQIPLEGMLRITHGEYDFVSASDGVICGLWTGDVSNDFTQCFYGLRINGTALNPMINGVVDTTQALAINLTSRYIFRTIYQMQSQNRFGQPYSYTDINGVVHTVQSPSKTDVAEVQTFIAEIDPATGNLLSRTTWNNTGIPLTADQCYGSYVPVASNNLNLTFTGVTISTPMQATLGLLQKFRPNFAYALGTYVHPSVFNGDYYKVTTAGTSAAEPNPWPTGLASTVISGGVTFTDIGTSPKFNPQLVGPNEIDSLDGLAPIGTITDANQGTTTRSSKLGSGQYNFGNPALHFFTDTVNLTNTIPWAGDLIKLTYRRAAVAMARAQDATSITSEATAWNDDGKRSVVRGLSGDIAPPPRNSAECLIAAQAIVNDLGRQRWDGTYKGTNLYSFTGQPISGTTMLFQNMPASYPTSLKAEVIQEVRSKFVSTRQGSTLRDVFEYDLSFGSRDTLKKAVAKFTKKVDVFQQDTVELPPAIDITGVATAFAPDVLAPTLESWDTNFNCNTNMVAPVGGGFEVRYTDAGWGTSDGKNLIYKGATQTFSTPRNYRGKVVFVRAYNAAGKYSQYAAGLHIALPLIPPPPTGTIDETIPTAPIITFIMPNDMQDVWGVEARTNINNPNGLVTDTTVLYHSDLVDSSYTTTFTDVNNLSLVMDYLLYTYNLLNEYSTAFDLTQINPYVQRDSVTGQNLLGNAGFEKNLLALQLNTERLPTQVLIDDWFVHGVLV